MASLTLNRLEKRFPGGTQAIADLNLSVADGELVVLVGPSGCGKSTVLRCIAGIESASGGEILIGGRHVQALPPQARRVGMVFQDYALYPHKSVRENLAFPLQMQRVPRGAVSSRVQAIASMLELDALLDRRPAQLSGGQRQRVAMGRALVRDADVLLLDEPLSNLDARLRIEVREQIRALQRRTGTTMLYVTHDQVEAMTLGDRVAVLDRGRLQQLDDARRLYRDPVNAFVAGFIGNPPMNLFPTVVDADAAGEWSARLGTAPIALAVDARLRAALGPWLGRAITAGLRPEAFSIAGAEPGAIAATVRNCEQLGHETLIHAEAGGTAFVARVAGMHDLAHGAPIALRADPSAMRFFGPDGAALLPARPGGA
ncbi:MAG: ABC transporter ATP-binding protein [Gammaproteobacteria bacterium]